MISTFQRIKRRVALFRQPKPESVIRILEGVVIGRPIWQLVEVIRNEQLARSLPSEVFAGVDDLRSRSARRRIRARANWAHDRVLYGRAVNFAMRRAASAEKENGAVACELRDLIYGRVIDTDGEREMGRVKATLIFTLGIAWHVIGVLIAALLLTLLWESPLNVVTSLTITLLIVAVFSLCLAHVNAISIRPPLVARRPLVSDH